MKALRMLQKILLALVSGIGALLIVLPAILLRVTPETSIRVYDRPKKNFKVLFI